MYKEVYSIKNLINAWKKARNGKTQKKAVTDFEEDLENNLLKLHKELKSRTYRPKPLETFILRDPKTRIISKSDFRDRVVHHALINVVGSIFEKQFIYDSCANQVGKGNLFALERFNKHARKVTKNYTKIAFCLKADIKHYFDEINHEILMEIISRRIRDKNILGLIWRILSNTAHNSGGGRTTPRNAPRQFNFSILRKCLP
jgi:retron-type reverse transcriptase